MTSLGSRTAIRRATLLCPDGALLALAPELATATACAPLGPAAVIDQLAAYLLDPAGRTIVARDDATAAWCARSPLLRPWGPTCAMPIVDEVAAVVAALRCADAPALPPEWLERRFAPRADLLLAAAVATLAHPTRESPEANPEAGARALAQLRQPGPDEATVHQALLQAGRALAWAPALHDDPVATAIVDELFACGDALAPTTLLATISALLGPLARAATALGARVRDELHERLDRAAALLTALDDPESHPAAGLAMALTRALGAASPHDPDAFIPWHARIEEIWRGLPLMPAFIDGLIAGGNPLPVATLVESMLQGDPDDRALAAELAGQLPLDDAAPALLALAGDDDPALRRAAVPGLALVGAIDPLIAILDDDDPAVAAAAALALVDLGLADQVRTRRPDDPDLARRAAVDAATGANGTDTLGELAVLLVERLDADELLLGSPLVGALAASVLVTERGLDRAIALVEGIPPMASMLAMALPAGGAGICAPSSAVARLAGAIDEATVGDPDAARLGLGVIARLSSGDAALVPSLVAALAAAPDAALALLMPIGELRVRATELADALAPHVTPDAPYRRAALAAAGVATPIDHPLWATLAAYAADLDDPDRDAAWDALVARVRGA